MRPDATIRPRSIITTDSQSRSTSSSWWLENTTGAPASACRRRISEDVDADRVQTRERLVQHEHLRPVHERGRELDALLVAERERLGAVAGSIGDAEARSSDRPASARPRVRGRGDARYTS